jgi:hypothetical protein
MDNLELLDLYDPNFYDLLDPKIPPIYVFFFNQLVIDMFDNLSGQHIEDVNGNIVTEYPVMNGAELYNHPNVDFLKDIIAMDKNNFKYIDEHDISNILILFIATIYLSILLPINYPQVKLLRSSIIDTISYIITNMKNIMPEEYSYERLKLYKLFIKWNHLWNKPDFVTSDEIDRMNNIINSIDTTNASIYSTNIPIYLTNTPADSTNIPILPSPTPSLTSFATNNPYTILPSNTIKPIVPIKSETSVISNIKHYNNIFKILLIVGIFILIGIIIYLLFIHYNKSNTDNILDTTNTTPINEG